MKTDTEFLLSVDKKKNKAIKVIRTRIKTAVGIGASAAIFTICFILFPSVRDNFVGSDSCNDAEYYEANSENGIVSDSEENVEEYVMFSERKESDNASNDLSDESELKSIEFPDGAEYVKTLNDNTEIYVCGEKNILLIGDYWYEYTGDNFEEYCNNRENAG